MLFPFAIILVLAAFLSCSSDVGFDGDGSSNSSNSINQGGGNSSSSGGGGGVVDGWPFTSDGETLTSTPGLDALDISNRIDIEFRNGNEPVISNPYTDIVTITKTGEDVIIAIKGTSTEIYSFVLSGTTSNGSIKFYGPVQKNLYLNGVNITNTKGPAINIQYLPKQSKKVTVHLVNGKQNYLADGPTYSDPPGEESAKGTFFSEGKIDFEGSGSLEIKAKYSHAIVIDNDLEIHNGRIIVSEAVRDGIHVNNKIKIKGGVLDIKSQGDAIQSEKPNTSGDQDWVTISGGKIKAQTTGIKSHGITSEGPIEIDGNATVVQISVSGNGSKGIKSSDDVAFKGGKTFIKVSGTKHTDNDDESTPSGIKTNKDLFIDNGELTIKSPGSEAKGISIDGDGTIKAGKIDIDADDDGIKVKGQLKIQGGTLSVKSKKKKAIDGSYDKNSCTPATGCTLVDGGAF
jgi:hypothetical protein